MYRWWDFSFLISIHFPIAEPRTRTMWCRCVNPYLPPSIAIAWRPSGGRWSMSVLFLETIFWNFVLNHRCPISEPHLKTGYRCWLLALQRRWLLNQNGPNHVPKHVKLNSWTILPIVWQHLPKSAPPKKKNNIQQIQSPPERPCRSFK